MKSSDFMKSDENLIRVRDNFREAAELIDELLILEEREKNGENVKSEVERVLGRFMIVMMGLEVLKEL